ncbi:hypothetical protein RO21_09745, partial [[Actinobacillus] muris]
MNKIFKVVFNHSTQTWRAVPELARGNCKSSRQSSLKPSKLTIVGILTPIFASYTFAASIGLHALNYQTPGNLGMGGEHHTTEIPNLHQGKEAKAHEDGGVAIGAKSKAGLGGVALGGAAQTENSGVAIGTTAKAAGNNSLAIMRQSSANGKYAIAIGTAASAEKKSGIAIGQHSYANAENAIVIGSSIKDANVYDGNQNAQASANDAIGIGTKVRVSGEKGIAIGREANASVLGGVALGANSVADRAKSSEGYLNDVESVKNTTKGTLGSISVGSAEATRQITNVAAGKEDTDAANIAQLKAVADMVKGTIVRSGTGGVTVNETEENGKQVFTVNITPAETVGIEKGDGIDITNKKVGDKTIYKISAIPTETTKVTNGKNITVTSNKSGDKTTYNVALNDDITVSNLTATNNVNAKNITAAEKVKAKDVEATNVKATDVNTTNVTATNNVNAKNITAAEKVKAKDVE